jgi:hypothetical protein
MLCIGLDSEGARNPICCEKRPRHRRHMCQAIAEQFDARLASLDAGNKIALQFHEIQLSMGPSTPEFLETAYELERYKRSFPKSKFSRSNDCWSDAGRA